MTSLSDQLLQLLGAWALLSISMAVLYRLVCRLL